MVAGFQPLWGSELDADVAQVHGDNIPGDIYVGDVTALDPAELSRPDVLCISPPCQAWSVARRTAVEERCDANVGGVGLRFVAELQPDTVFLENVPKYAKSAVFKSLVAGLRKFGYTVRYKVFSATHFGVSQKRSRLLLVASRGEIGPWPAPVAPRGWYDDVADLINELPESNNLARWQLRGMDPCLPQHYPILIVGGNPTTCNIGGKTYRKSWYGPNQIGPTMVASVKAMSGTRIMHPDWLVRFSPRCGARIMGFPDNYALPESSTIAWRVLGNAVPPPVSTALFWHFGGDV